jgi:ribosomal protein S18 acetylase RimI-like enzyme
LAEIFIRCWKDAYRGIVADEIIDGLNNREVEHRWRRLGSDATAAEGSVVVAMRDGNPLGMSRFGPDEEDARRGHLYSLYVDPAAGGTGIGRALLEHATGELAAAGYRTATLWVFSANERAIRFYRAAGWEPDGTERVEPEWQAVERRMTITLQRSQR